MVWCIHAVLLCEKTCLISNLHFLVSVKSAEFVIKQRRD
jgi:hypothetical protein